MSDLRVVADETPPLPTQDALRKACNFQLLEEPRSYNPASLKLLREQAEAAANAWQNVAAKLAEIQREYQKTKNARR